MQIVEPLYFFLQTYSTIFLLKLPMGFSNEQCSKPFNYIKETDILERSIQPSLDWVGPTKTLAVY